MSTRLRIVVFASGGPIARCALEALEPAHEIVGLVRVHSRLGSFVRAIVPGTRDDIGTWAATRRIPVLRFDRARDRALAERVQALRPDAGCIATFPFKLGPATIAASGAVCVNVHTSLLPRHRGPNPMFWIYHADDRETGTSLHVVSDRLDAGDVLASERFSVGRGESVVAVHTRAAQAGGRVLVQALERVARGEPRGTPQDEAAATQAPRPVPGRRYADLAGWGSERAWHFLAGLAARYREPLSDSGGAPVSYREVRGFEVCTPRHAPGSVTRDGAGWDAWTMDGVVKLC